LTEALAEHRASLLSGAESDPGGERLDRTVADLADSVERLLALVAYLAQPDADLAAVAGGHGRPVRASRPAVERQVWRVGGNPLTREADCHRQ